ncbi:MAG: SGNH/GDSL hydrolase family protein [bacterium]|nr:SGNH/GDSL hydrolase family protein [bacterium]
MSLARVLALLASSAIAIGAAVYVLTGRGPIDLAFHRVEPTDYARAQERLAALRPEARRGASGLLRLPLDEETVRAVLPLRGKRRRYEPFSYFTWKPDLIWTRKWEEHPDGAYPIRTNGLGFRHDGEVHADADFFVVVAGDSHMGGVCANAESLAGRLASGLRARHPDRSIEVLNTAHGAYTFYNYLGVLERLLELGMAPDLFLIVVYGGNDFLGGVHLWHLFEGTSRPARVSGGDALVAEVAERYPSAFGQCLNQIESFATRGETKLALKVADTVTREIANVCAREGIELLVAYLPSPHELPDQAPQAEIEEAAAALGLSRGDLEQAAEVGDAYLGGLKGIDVADLRGPFREHSGALYWSRDLHLNLAGHDWAARSLLPLTESVAERFLRR